MYCTLRRQNAEILLLNLALHIATTELWKAKIRRRLQNCLPNIHTCSHTYPDAALSMTTVLCSLSEVFFVAHFILYVQYIQLIRVVWTNW